MVMVGRFQFGVSGTMQQGCIYVTTGRRPGERDDAMRLRATKMAAKRSGDPAPVLFRDNLNGDLV